MTLTRSELDHQMMTFVCDMSQIRHRQVLGSTYYQVHEKYTILFHTDIFGQKLS